MDMERWAAPQEYIEAARAVMGSVCIDPASSELATGIDGEWHGNVWLNPSRSRPFMIDSCHALVDKYLRGEISQACVLVNSETEAAWFQWMLSYASAVCFVQGPMRLPQEDGTVVKLPEAQAIVYYGPAVEAFANGFKGAGAIMGELTEP